MADEIMDEQLDNEPQEPQGAEQHETDWKAEARKWEKRAKAAQAHMAQQPDANALSDLQAQIDAIRSENDALKHAAEVDSLKKAAAAATGVPVDVLRGDTAEEINAHAEALKAFVNAYPSVSEGGRGSKSTATKESILAIANDKERLQAIKDNAELFA